MTSLAWLWKETSGLVTRKKGKKQNLSFRKGKTKDLKHAMFDRSTRDRVCIFLVSFGEF